MFHFFDVLTLGLTFFLFTFYIFYGQEQKAVFFSSSSARKLFGRLGASLLTNQRYY